MERILFILILEEQGVSEKYAILVKDKETTMELKKQIEIKEKELEVLKEKLKLEENKRFIDKNFIQIICKELKKEFRIYKWENKPFKDFPIPKDFKWCKYSDFIYLYDNDLFKIEKYPSVYITENKSNKNIKKGFGVSRLFLGRLLVLFSSDKVLAGSADVGRVVVERKLSK